MIDFATIVKDGHCFPGIPAGRFLMSVQGSETHYSHPRINLPTLEGYTHMEVAIFEDGAWVRPLSDERFAGREWAALWEDSPAPVAGYLPVETVQEIHAFLSVMYGAPV